MPRNDMILERITRLRGEIYSYQEAQLQDSLLHYIRLRSMHLVRESNLLNIHLFSFVNFAKISKKKNRNSHEYDMEYLEGFFKTNNVSTKKIAFKDALSKEKNLN